MARIYLIRNMSFNLAYTVEQAVGQGCPNRQDDVMLVQLFLRVAMDDAPGSLGYRPPGQMPITIDGVCGLTTINYIKYFEDEGNRRNPGFPTSTDRRIDPVLSGTQSGSISHTFYKIIALNVLYYKRRGAAMQADIGSDPLCPAGLARSLYIS